VQKMLESSNTFYQFMGTSNVHRHALLVDTLVYGRLVKWLELNI